jgi:hypothetical protein
MSINTECASLPLSSSNVSSNGTTLELSNPHMIEVPTEVIAHPALRGALIIAYCRAWLVQEEENQLRTRLSDCASDKHNLKSKLLKQQNKFEGQEKLLRTELGQVEKLEESLRNQLDELSKKVNQLQANSMLEADKNTNSTQIKRRTLGANLFANNAEYQQLTAAQDTLWKSLEESINHRNQINTDLAIIDQSKLCIQQGLYASHLFVREKYVALSDKNGSVAIVTNNATNANKQSDSILDSGAVEHAVDHTVKSVNQVDEWTLSAVHRLNALRNKELNYEKKLTKLIQGRETIFSYFMKIDKYKRKVEQDNNIISINSIPHTGKNNPHNLNNNKSERKAVDDKLSRVQVNALVFDHRNRRVLQRICQHMEASGLLQDRRLNASTAIQQCFSGSDLVVWLSKSSIVPTQDDALLLCDLLLRAGLIDLLEIDATSSQPVSIRSQYKQSNSFGDMKLLHTLFCMRSAGSSSIGEISKSGWLEKIGRWRNYRRYFVFDADLHRLAYFESNKHDVPTKIYWLSSSTIIRSLESQQQQANKRWSTGTINGSSNSQQFYFEIEFVKEQNGDQTLLLSAASNNDRNQWLRVLWLSGCQYPGMRLNISKTIEQSQTNSPDHDFASEPALSPTNLNLNTLNHNSNASAAQTSQPPSRSASRRTSLDDLDVATGTTGNNSRRSSIVGANTDLGATNKDKREIALMTEFNLTRTKNKLILASAFTNIEHKQDVEQGFIEILRDIDDISTFTVEDSTNSTQSISVDYQELDRYDFSDEEGDFEDNVNLSDDEETAEEDQWNSKEPFQTTPAHENKVDEAKANTSNEEKSVDVSAEYSQQTLLARRCKVERVMKRLNLMLQSNNNAFGRLLFIFTKLFRTLYSSALEDTTATQIALPRSNSIMNVPSHIRYNSAASALTIQTDDEFSPLNAARGQIAPLSSSRARVNTFNILSDSLPAVVNPLIAQARSFQSIPAPRLISGSAVDNHCAATINNNILSSTPPSSSRLMTSGGKLAEGLTANQHIQISAQALQLAADCPRHLRHSLVSGVEDIQAFLARVRGFIHSHLQSSEVLAAESQLAGLLGSDLFLSSLDPNSLISPTPSHSSTLDGSHSFTSNRKSVGGKKSSNSAQLKEREKDIASILNACQRLISRHVFNHVYSVLFPVYIAKYAQKQSLLAKKLDEVARLKFLQLGLSPDLILPGLDEALETNVENSMGLAQTAYGYAVIELLHLPAVSDPADQLSCVMRVARNLCRCLDEHNHKHNQSTNNPLRPVIINADDLLILFCYLLARCRKKLVYLSAQLAMMSDYLNAEQRVTLRGYYLATLQAAVELIQTDALHVRNSNSPTLSSQFNSSAILLDKLVVI